MLIAFAPGPMEMIIILIIGFMLFGLPIIVLLAIIWAVMPRKSQASMANWKASAAKGTPVQVRVLGAADKPIASSANWDGSELVVKANEWSTKSLFDVPLAGLDQCILTYRFRIKTDHLTGAVYPEMWCRIPEKGQFFSRGLDRKIRGAADWSEVEIPFFLQTGQQADLLHLNLVFEGPGAVRLKDIEVLSIPIIT